MVARVQAITATTSDNLSPLSASSSSSSPPLSSSSSVRRYKRPVTRSKRDTPSTPQSVSSSSSSSSALGSEGVTGDEGAEGAGKKETSPSSPTLSHTPRNQTGRLLYSIVIRQHRQRDKNREEKATNKVIPLFPSPETINAERKRRGLVPAATVQVTLMPGRRRDELRTPMLRAIASDAPVSTVVIEEVPPSPKNEDGDSPGPTTKVDEEHKNKRRSDDDNGRPSPMLDVD